MPVYKTHSHICMAFMGLLFHENREITAGMKNHGICIQSRKGFALCIEKKNKIVYTEFIKAEKDGAVR